MTTTSETKGWEWACVEIMGFRKHVGRVREEERFGAKMLRIDIPVKGDPIANGWETHWYGGSSIFSLTLTDEESVMRHNKPYEPPARVRLPAPVIDVDPERGHVCSLDAVWFEEEGRTMTEADRIKEIADRAEARSRERKGAA